MPAETPLRLQTRAQTLAVAIHRCVLERKNGATLKEDGKKRYGATAHSLPILVRSAGLAQALAFLETRTQPGAKELLDDLAAVLGYASGAALCEESRSAELMEYILLTRQTLAALDWFKRFAESVLNVRATEAANLAESDSQ